MIIRLIDDTGDWQFGKGLSSYAQAEQAIAENLRTRILSWFGDCFFALQEGVDWANRLDYGQKQNLTDDLKAIILQSFGVVAVNNIAVTFDGATRAFRATYDIQTIYSPSFQGEIDQNAGAGLNA